MKVLPIFLNDLDGRRCVVFWGGHEAERKVGDLLDCDAEVTLISPTLTEGLQAWAAEGRITWHARTYRPGDLKDAFLAIVSEVDPEGTAPIWQEAQAEKVLFNAMDDVQHCSFVSGSVVRRGPLTLSISTSGCAPALSVRLRQRLETMLGPEYADFLKLMRSLRAPMARHYPDFETRRALWYTLVDSDIIDYLRANDPAGAQERVASIAGQAVADEAFASPTVHV